MRALPSLIAAAGLVLAAQSARAEGGPPVLDVEKTCRDSQSANVSVSDKASLDGCLRSERAAQEEIKKRWGEFSAAAKNQCSKQAVAGGYPSYVETVTCLELATGTAPAGTGSGEVSTGGAGPSRGSATRDSKGSDLTAEPSPKQRTNPIDVLERKP